MSTGSGAAADSGILGMLPLARSAVDRAAERRTDTAWLASAWAAPGTRVVPIDDGRALVRFGEGSAAEDGVAAGGAAEDSAAAGGAAEDSAAAGGAAEDSAAAGGAELVFVSPREAPEGVRFLLGVDAAGVIYFGVAGPLPGTSAGPSDPGAAAASRNRAGSAIRPAVRPASLREVGQLLGDRDAGLMTHAVALANWHSVSTHCSRCGAVTEPVSSGHARRCPVDDSEHFPRLDPAVIMLVTDPAGRCLLARNSRWPQRRVSILAGFVEPGESAEQAVAREVLEETGISVGQVRYLGSQPWPMPHSLMLGFGALAAGEQEIRVDADEIAEAGWFSREDVRASVASGTLLLPPPVSIAHRIIESWYGAELPGSW